MAKTVLLCGYGPGISKAVAEKLADEGFDLAIVARDASRVAVAAESLRAKGIRAEGFSADLADPSAVRALVERVRAALGPVSVLHWNAHGGEPGDLLAEGSVGTTFDLLDGLLAAVHGVLPDLRADAGSAAILVTNGGLGYIGTKVDALAIRWNAMGAAVANAAKHKLMGLLAGKLAPEGIFVGEVVVHGLVKGSAADQGNATVDPATVAESFWTLYQRRSEILADVQ